MNRRAKTAAAALIPRIAHILAVATIALSIGGCKQQPPASTTNQNTEVKPVVGDPVNTTAASSNSAAAPTAAEPLKTITGGKLSDEKAVVGASEAPKIVKLKGGSVCYVYRKYAVVVTQTDEVGEEIKVIVKIGPSDESFMTDPKKAPAYFKVPEGDNFFFGVYDDFLFIDNGTGQQRGLDIYDLFKKKKVYSDNYAEPISLDKDQRLTYYEDVEEKKLKKKPDCPEAEKWKADSMGVGYEEKVSLDLKTLKLDRSGVVRCAPRE